MELELMNIFHLYQDEKIYVIRCNCTKKQMAEALKEFAKDEPTFRRVKFSVFMHKQGYKFYYEQ
jgi:hypothetical protein